AVRQPGLPTSAARAWDRAEHESQGKLLRQRGDRELLQHAEAGVGLPRGVRGPRGGERVTVRVHRGVLQSPASALDAGLSQSHPVRATIRLVNPSERPRLVGKVTAENCVNQNQASGSGDEIEAKQGLDGTNPK